MSDRGNSARRFGVLALSAATGYVSLSQEILWMRLFAYNFGGGPRVFANVLGAFLIGVALGALVAERLCENRLSSGADRVVRLMGGLLVASAIVFYFGISLSAFAMTISLGLGLLIILLAVVAVSFLLGMVFPLLCHYASRKEEAAGITVSRIYVANIAGSTLGPLLTGFVLMEHFPTDRIILGLSLGALLLGALVLLWDSPRTAAARSLAVACIGALMLFGFPPLYRNLLEKFQFTREYRRSGPYKLRVENRSGIIAISRGEDGTPDIIYGGGVYDGRFNTDPVNDSNGIRRAYMIGALHQNPAEVLEVGLSSASWTRVMANYLPIRRLTVVEINPGYKEVISRYPEQRTVLSDPKVTIVIDDGRRWLTRNPHARFDLIVQNTTFHTRSNITNLLSEEYLRLCKSHLNPGGVLYYNATGSKQVPYTAAHVFRHVTGYGNFVAASDSPFDLRPDEIRANLLKFRVQGMPVFAEDRPEMRGLLSKLSASDIHDRAPQLRARTSLWKITDDNMATEFRDDRWYSPEWSWAAFFKRQSSQRPTGIR